ncbi:chemotaxis protein [Ensifer soli]|uniref:chemotaxis protein n=1 Tax=Ciceribacter sp. sgz301302 TaxID=3342379 RepID=UPI0035B7C459
MHSHLKRITIEAEPRPVLEQKLSIAHARIEKSFLDGGAVLVSVMEILNRLVELLDRLTGTLDGETTTGTIAGLKGTVAELAKLPGIEEARQSTFRDLTGICASTNRHVEDMRETIRYLRTFAVTVKITGAGLAEFAEFADEIRERIQSGGREVDSFAGHLADMRRKLEGARRFSGEILTDFNATIPRIVRDLTESSGALASQHREMSDIAAEVKRVAQGVQMKIATVLSALQIGDITRQRIEHIQSTFDAFDAFARSDAGTALGKAALADLEGAILQLCEAQIREMVADFEKEARNIHGTIARFTRDAGEILALHERLGRKLVGEGIGGERRTVLQSMEATIADACRLVGRVEGSSRDADEVVLTVVGTADDLMKGIEVIRAIKTDIHYMALNSNLRCSRLGDEGRAVNVVSGELRHFAAQLEGPADATVTELRKVEAAAQALTRKDGVTVGDIGGPLTDALAAIRGVCAEMETGLTAFSEEGQAVFSRMNAAIATLDFQTELGGVLGECVDLAAGLAPRGTIDLDGIAEAIAPLSAGIHGVYTMAQERVIHAAFLPLAASAALPPVTAENEEDLFADALF